MDMISEGTDQFNGKDDELDDVINSSPQSNGSTRLLDVLADHDMVATKVWCCGVVIRRLDIVSDNVISGGDVTREERCGKKVANVDVGIDMSIRLGQENTSNHYKVNPV